MTRLEFTKKITHLILRMIDEGEDPLLDYVKRSDQEQAQLHYAGKSECDGHIKISQHQRGKAADIYFFNHNYKSMIGPPQKGHYYWHTVWETMGGKPMISWDQGHFEG